MNMPCSKKPMTALCYDGKVKSGNWTACKNCPFAPKEKK